MLVLYEVVIDEVVLAKDMERDNAFEFAEQYLANHNGENVTLLVRRQKDSVIECQ